MALDLRDVQAVIDSAKERDNGRLTDFIRAKAPEASEGEVTEAAAIAVEAIEMVPLVLAMAADAADERGLEVAVMPLLEYAREYFIDPMDVIPEMTQGLVGLLDDTYLTLRLLENLNSGADPLLDTDFGVPLRFLRSLMGREVSLELDVASVVALQKVSRELSRVWGEMGHPS